MAVTKTYSNVTIRGITYSKGSSFKCYAAVKGNGGSEGNASSASAPTVGTTYYFYCKASGSNVSYPYAISATSGGSVKGWYTEAIFPYATYSVKYNPNGGSGAPSNQTKTYGTNLTLSSTKPTRTGYTFKGWGISASDTSVDYAAGATYSKNAAITLYAIWQANTYTISYNPNGGSGAPGSQIKTYGVNLKLSTTKPTRTNYEFLGWSTNKNASTATYAAGGTFTTNATTTLYAIWKLKYVLPSITNLKAIRCDADGNADDFGTCAKVTFNWSCSQLISSNPVTSITANGGTVTAEEGATGTSGSVTKILGTVNPFSIENAYTITVTVVDSLKYSGSGTTTKTTTLPAAIFAIDFKSGGKGVAIGKPATEENLFDVQFPAKFRGGVDIGNTKIKGINSSWSWYNGRDGALLASTNNPSTSYHPLTSSKTQNGSWQTGVYTNDKYYITYTPDSSYNSGSNTGYVHGMIIEPNGDATFPGYVVADRMQISNPNSDTYYNAESGDYSLSFGIGSGKVNRGIYDHTRGQWMIFNDATDTVLRTIGAFYFYADTDASTTPYGVVVGNSGSKHPLVRPVANGYGYLGGSNYKWAAVYASNGTIQTSDRNQKEQILDIDQKYEELFARLRPVTYYLKGDNHDRLHIGFIAQDVEEAMNDIGLTAMDLAAFCVDYKTEFDEETKEEKIVLDENGKPIELYSLRYTEFIALNTRMIQKQAKTIEDQQETITQQQNKINDLESRLAALEALLGVE